MSVTITVSEFKGLSLATFTDANDFVFKFGPGKAAKMVPALDGFGDDGVFQALTLLANGTEFNVEANAMLNVVEFKGHKLLAFGEGDDVFSFGAKKAALLAGACEVYGTAAVMQFIRNIAALHVPTPKATAKPTRKGGKGKGRKAA